MELQLNFRKITLNNWRLAGEKPYNQGLREEATLRQDPSVLNHEWERREISWKHSKKSIHGKEQGKRGNTVGPITKPRDAALGLATHHQLTGHEFLEDSILRIHLPAGPNFWGHSKILKPRPRNSGVSQLPPRYFAEPETKSKATGWKGTGDAITWAEDSYLGKIPV